MITKEERAAIWDQYNIAIDPRTIAEKQFAKDELLADIPHLLNEIDRLETGFANSVNSIRFWHERAVELLAKCDELAELKSENSRCGSGCFLTGNKRDPERCKTCGFNPATKSFSELVEERQTVVNDALAKAKAVIFKSEPDAVRDDEEAEIREAADRINLYCSENFSSIRECDCIFSNGDNCLITDVPYRWGWFSSEPTLPEVFEIGDKVIVTCNTSPEKILGVVVGENDGGYKVCVDNGSLIFTRNADELERMNDDEMPNESANYI